MSIVRWARVPALVLPLAIALAACGDDETATSGNDDPTITSTSAAGGGQAGTTVTTGGTATTAAANVAVINVTVSGNSVSGETRRRVNLNQRVSLTVTADATDEVHVHGYNLTAPVSPGYPAELSFAANIPGVFEVELERAHKVLFNLEVRS